MDIKPKFESGTIKINLTPVKIEKLESKVKKDPSGIIPNGIYKVIRWEQIRQKITLSITSAIIFATALYIFIHALWFPMAWGGYIIPSSVALLAIWKLSLTLIEKRYLKSSVAKYKEELELEIGANSYPAFMVRIYEKLHIKQYRHNWLTFVFLFYVGIFTLLLWWLKDVHWWIFHFDSWIKSMFHNPNLMAILFSVSLGVVAVLHVAMAIQRKRRIMEIDAFFGQAIVPSSQIDETRRAMNKAYGKLFVISLMILVIIPIVVKVILKTLRRKA